MQQAALHNFPAVPVEYAFKCRNDNIDLLSIREDIRKEIQHLCTLEFKPDELDYLSRIPFLTPDYIDFLENYRLREKHITISERNGKLDIRIRGSWINAILFEVPILAIVSEVYFRNLLHDDRDPALGEILHLDAREEGRIRLEEKIALVKAYNEEHRDMQYWPTQFTFSDFGMRRRFSSIWQDEIVATLKEKLPTTFVGTSNVFLAKKYGVKYIGTMAHEWIMVGQALPNVRLSESEKYMLETWVKEFRGDLGIALSDTLGFDFFRRDFDKFFAKLYDGCRHDSGDPYDWCSNLISHYETLGIDPKTKTAVFSDGLTFPLALNLTARFGDRIKTSFGIGTNLTNDVGLTPLNNVIKLVKVNGSPVAKLSDDKGKGMCEDEAYLSYLQKVVSRSVAETWK
jgi:nicotinate phosphoribosyltransferase